MVAAVVLCATYRQHAKRSSIVGIGREAIRCALNVAAAVLSEQEKMPTNFGDLFGLRVHRPRASSFE